MKRLQFTIPIYDRPSYRPGCGPPIKPLTLLPSDEETGWRIYGVLYYKGLPQYQVTPTNNTYHRELVRKEHILDWVSPNELENFEYKQEKERNEVELEEETRDALRAIARQQEREAKARRSGPKVSKSSIDRVFQPAVFRYRGMPPPTKRLRCNVCNKSFKHESSIIRHKQVKHIKLSKLRFDCLICGEKFTQEDELSSHRKIKHSNRASGSPSKTNAGISGQLGVQEKRNFSSYLDGDSAEDSEPKRQTHMSPPRQASLSQTSPSQPLQHDSLHALAYRPSHSSPKLAKHQVSPSRTSGSSREDLFESTVRNDHAGMRSLPTDHISIEDSASESSETSEPESSADELNQSDIRDPLLGRIPGTFVRIEKPAYVIPSARMR
jgi:hypothetical protein